MGNIDLDQLNPVQQQAATHIAGPLLIMAGAGSGKTRVLTCRIAYLLEQGIKPWEILAITFTNKAAKEMKTRVEQLVGKNAREIWLSTFHAFCAKLLRMEAESTGIYTRHFTIYDETDTRALLKECLKELELAERQFSVGGVSGTISSAKNKLIDPELFARQADSYYEQKVASVYSLYQKKLRANNALDFDDLLMVTVELLEGNPQVLEKYRSKFRYIMVDEYQDTNHAQYALTTLLAAAHRNLCVVGDADQSIYGWRGADISNILDFEKDYPEASIIKLEQNYRSTQVILDAANALIEKNSNRKPKMMWTEKTGGALVNIHVADDQHAEARHVADQVIRLHHAEALPYGGVAVLYRTNAQSRTIEEEFLKYGIPYTIVGGVRFYDRKEIKDMLAYLRVIQNPADSVSMRRIINVPRRGVGDTTLAHLQAMSEKTGRPLWEFIKNIREIGAITGKARTALFEFSMLLETMREAAAKESVADLITRIMKGSGYIQELEQEGTPEADARIENLQELVTVAREYSSEAEEDTLEDFLSHVALVSDLDTTNMETDRVTLMTLHAAKGLEFPVVFLTGMEEGMFPHFRTQANPQDMEEERRLCYVGITRAEKQVFMSRAKVRMIYGETRANMPSRFLDEIPDALAEKPVKPQQKNVIAVRSQSLKTTPLFAKPGSPLRMDGGATSGKTVVTWQIGDKVVHPTWNHGTVVEVKGQGEDQELKVAFPGQGLKALAVKYAPIRRA